MRNYMPAIDDKQCPVNGNHVVDLSCFNDRLTVILHQLEGRN
jgi:hypothetical protein